MHWACYHLMNSCLRNIVKQKLKKLIKYSKWNTVKSSQIFLHCWFNRKTLQHELCIAIDQRCGNHHVDDVIQGWCTWLSLAVDPIVTYVSQSDILGPIAYLSDIENLVLLERVMSGDYSFKYKIQLFLLFMSIPQH